MPMTSPIKVRHTPSSSRPATSPAPCRRSRRPMTSSLPSTVRGAARRQQRVEPRAHLGARCDGRCPDLGVVQEVDEELSEAGSRPGHHLLIVRGGKSEILVRQPYRDLPGERLDDVDRPASLEQLADDLGGVARDDVLDPRQVLPPHHQAHDGDIVIIARRDVLAQNEWANHAHHPRQVRAHGEDFLTMEDFLHVPELSYQRRHWALEDWSVIAQLLEERKRVASNLLHDELELLAGDLLWVAALPPRSRRTRPGLDPPNSVRLVLCAPVTSSELSVVVMARTRLSAHMRIHHRAMRANL